MQYRCWLGLEYPPVFPLLLFFLLDQRMQKGLAELQICFPGGPGLCAGFTRCLVAMQVCQVWCYGLPMLMFIQEGPLLPEQREGASCENTVKEALELISRILEVHLLKGKKEINGLCAGLFLIVLPWDFSICAGERQVQPPSETRSWCSKYGGTGLSPPLLLWDQSLARCAGPDCKLSPRRRKQREGEGQRDEVVLLLEGPQGPPRGKRLTWKHWLAGNVSWG